MGNRVIDLDRGVMQMRHTKTGTYIYMYLDNPGFYLNYFGKPIPEIMAKEAGFDIVKFGKARMKKERMSAAEREIAAALELINEAEELIVIEELGEFRLVDKGLGRASVIDADGNEQNPMPLPLEEAKVFLKYLADAGGGDTTETEVKVDAGKPQTKAKAGQ